MSGIRELLGFQFWVDNAKRAPIEALLAEKKKVPKERAAILRELEEEARLMNGNGNLAKRISKGAG